MLSLASFCHGFMTYVLHLILHDKISITSTAFIPQNLCPIYTTCFLYLCHQVKIDKKVTCLLLPSGTDFQRFTLNLLFTKLYLVIISQIIRLASPFEQTLFTHTKDNLYTVVLEKIFKGLHRICYVQIVCSFNFADNVDGATI